MKISTIAASLCTALGLCYVAAIQVPAFLGSLSMLDSYNECGDAVAALNPDDLVQDSVKAQKKVQAACAGYQAKAEIAERVLSPARN